MTLYNTRMKLLYGKIAKTIQLNESVATIGNFDGVHRGHLALLKNLRQEAVRRQLPAIVILFEPQPNEFFLRDKAPPRLMSLREKIIMFERAGIDFVYCLRFNQKLAQMSAEAFANEYIFSHWGVKYLVVGHDFRFGSHRSGDVSVLRDLGKQYHCCVQSVSAVTDAEQRISSTLIRQMLAQADMQRAHALLGRPMSILGKVVYGLGLGRQWGIPTANIPIRRLHSPLLGIYCVNVYRAATGSWLKGVASIGRRPTISGVGQKILLEVHLFDCEVNLYGEYLQVQFLHRLRDEVRFASIDALIAQIRLDVQAAKDFFSRVMSDD